MTKIFKRQIFIPIAAMLALLLFNLIIDPSFFHISLTTNNAGDPVLSGNLISILNNGSELAILALGMTLVTAASGGQDISVGATIAIAGSVVLKIVCGANEVSVGIVLVAFLVACLVSMAFGAFNGALVSIFKIQPMVATLILFTAGRSIAAWINNNAQINISDPKFTYIAEFFPGLPIPTPFLITILCFIIMALFMKFTNIGLYSQAVGINENSSKLNGINPVFIKFLTFVILGLCVAVCGLIKVSRSRGITYSSIAENIEMDAILAVALGGNALGGGKFNMTASVIGAYVIQILTTTLYKYNISSAALSAYKAIVVIVLVVISAPTVRRKAKAVTDKIKANFARKEVA
ncbi:MAG: ABC transporter permease [Lachnospiraceae bacterium]|nr:ABC transporter permease [Lachnospiraceae bacterium]